MDYITRKQNVLDALTERVPGLQNGMLLDEAYQVILNRIVELETTIWMQEQLLGEPPKFRLPEGEAQVFPRR